MNDHPTNPIEFVRRYNAWRRGSDDSEMPHPKDIGESIDALCDHAERLERELAELTEDVGKCHDVLGEDRASDTSELWKFFESHKQISHRLRTREDELEQERALADRLAEALANVQGDYVNTGAIVMPEVDTTLAAWKASRDHNGASQKPFNPIPSADEIDAHLDECAARSERDWRPLDDDPSNLEGAGPADDERRENARAIRAMSLPKRIELLFRGKEGGES